MAQEPFPVVDAAGPRLRPRAKPVKVVPTERLNIAKQLDIVRAYAAASISGKPVTNADVGAIVNLKPETVALGNTFFVDIGFLTKAESGNGFLPSAEVIAFQRAHEWNPETAAHKLAPKIGASWFAIALMPRLAFRALEDDEALEVLADTAAAGPDYKPNLKLCIEYLVATGLMQRDGTMLKAVKSTAAAFPSSNGGDQQPKPPQPREPTTMMPTPPTAVVSTSFEAQPIHGGIVRFHVNVDVDMSEFKDWQPDRILAFFNGIAQVLAAKADVERGTTTK